MEFRKMSPRGKKTGAPLNNNDANNDGDDNDGPCLWYKNL